ncbi:primosomal protein N' [Rubellimicrobium sp. CFH 75288]|uniref:primosomal protein N' n=1 Tax=Rubellimicrobium sp. CFH 75288 TaxID=2697034 RepID=UPI001412803C|nr:primosomal protein N' [Rubellimicrobium sp. CFH 75288]NAZ36752.1 primosomal protein N' [Rubellimicrobium sp. CFH 75288]
MVPPPEEGRFAPGERVGVLPLGALDRLLDYAAPEGGVSPGAFVEVPLGPRRIVGVVWGRGTGEVPAHRLRAIGRVLDAPPLRAPFREFLGRAADYTLTPLPAMVRLATRAPGLTEGPATRHVYRLGPAEPPRMTEARARVLRVLRAHPGLAFTLSELAQAAGVGTSVVRGLVEAGAVEEAEAPRDQPYPPLDLSGSGVALTPDQMLAAASLRIAVEGRAYGTTLLRGVTGSGKTEVYLEAVAETLRQGRQALVLLPEIALTGAFLQRVEARFGAPAAEWHSGITQSERRRLWRQAAEGGASLVVGARSALFLPFRDLGLIVVDEEHDGSYKQEDGVLYNARDMAVLRAATEGAQVILASATPCLETWWNAETGKYARLMLPARVGLAVLPRVTAIDMRLEELARGNWVSPTLAAAVARRLERGEQSLLFLNRRGYAPVTLCRACGHQIGCPHCDARLVEHRFQRRLQCHQCGETQPIPLACPECGAEGRLSPVGPGVERLAEEVASLFPAARTAVLSSDLYGSARSLKEAIEQIAEGAADIVIGTQLVAKGHNFPRLTLAGVVDADLGLYGSDLRAAERTFALLRQVSGRAGRADSPGEALLQTYQPHHPVIEAILRGDDEGFWRAEAEGRRMAGMPPFSRLVALILSSESAQAAMDAATRLAREAEPLRRIGAEVWGPAPAPIARIRGRHRVRLLVRAPRAAPVQAAVAEWIAPVRTGGRDDLRLTVDVDPQSFL